MTHFDQPGPASAAGDPAVGAKQPAAGLDGRAPRPRAVRLRAGAVRIVVGGAALVLSGALAWAFVVQPELREAERTRQRAEAGEQPRGDVRPAEAVAAQPATYDRLPEPRSAGDRQVVAENEARAAPTNRASARPSADQGRSGRGEARLAAARSDLFFASAGRAGPPASLSVVDAPSPADRSGLVSPASPFELKAGDVIPALLLTAVDTSRPGPVTAVVTRDLFDTVAGRHLLVPQGSRLIGRHEGAGLHGDRRAFLTWTRLILPNGKSIGLGDEPGVDAQGAVGLPGRTDRRLGALATGVLAAGAITTLGQAARDRARERGGSWMADAGNAAAIEGAQIGGRLVDRELQVRPVVRVELGSAVRVLLTRDLVLEAYAP